MSTIREPRPMKPQHEGFACYPCDAHSNRHCETCYTDPFEDCEGEAAMSREGKWTPIAEQKACYCAVLNGGHDATDCAAFSQMAEALRRVQLAAKMQNSPVGRELEEVCRAALRAAGVEP